MKKEGKKYLIKESELKEIIQEMMLIELYNPDDYKDMYTPGYKGNTPMPKDYIRGAWNLIKNIPNMAIPDSWKEKAAEGDRGILQYILGLLGAQKAGTARADFLPSFAQAFKGEAQNADAHEQLNVNAAVNWLRNNAGRRTTRWCARYVRMALNRGGLGVPYGMKADSAKYYVNILPTNGWEEIPVNQAGELGDVVVIMPYLDSRGNTLHPDGHIAMCIGNGVWASDFIQNSMHGLNGTPPPPSAVHVFRYKNRV